MTSEKKQKKVMTFDFTKGKLDPKLRGRNKMLKDLELKGLKEKCDNLSKLLEKEKRKNENYQKYSNALEDERDKLAKLNEELVEFANSKLAVAWTERVIVACAWILSLVIAWFMWSK